MSYKAGQITSVITIDGKKYLVRIKKKNNSICTCRNCDFSRCDSYGRKCTLSTSDEVRCLTKIPGSCHLKILYECQKPKEEE